MPPLPGPLLHSEWRRGSLLVLSASTFYASNMNSTANARRLRREQTKEEKELWHALRAGRFAGFKFRRQHPTGIYALDFYCPTAKLSVELDGFQHGTPRQQAKDVERDAWLEASGVKVLRFWNSRLRREHDSIRETIWRTLQERAPHPLPDYCRPMRSPPVAQKPPSDSPSPRGRGTG